MKSHRRARQSRISIPLTLAMLLALNTARAETLRPESGTRSLQETIDAARAGDIVEVPRGSWSGPILIDHAITLRGVGGVIDGGGLGTVILVSAPGAAVEQLEVRGSGSDLGAPDSGIYVTPEAIGAVIRGNTIEDCAFGIWIHNTEGVEVSGNTIRGRSATRPADRGNGIHLFDSTNLKVVGNHVDGARDGIYVSATEDSLIADNLLENQRYGIHYMFSYSNTIRGNRVLDNRGGIALMQSRHLIVEDNLAEGNTKYGILFRDATLCTIRNNRLVANGEGMFFFSSTENLIEGNLLLRNEIGAKIWAGSRRNQVSDNAFLGNRQQVFYVGSSDLVWGEEQRGNFWSDYIGWDHDGDGIGDRPHRLDSFTSTLVYRYPSAATLLGSPALELLSHLESRMPLLRVPSVVDLSPRVER